MIFIYHDSLRERRRRWLCGPGISSLASDHDCCSSDRGDDGDDQGADDQDGQGAGAAVLLANLASSVQGVAFIAHA